MLLIGAFKVIPLCLSDHDQVISKDSLGAARPILSKQPLGRGQVGTKDRADVTRRLHGEDHAAMMPVRLPPPSAAAGRKGCWAADGARRQRVSETPKLPAWFRSCPCQRSSLADRTVSQVLKYPVGIVREAVRGGAAMQPRGSRGV
jgi:hypothetical protein